MMNPNSSANSNRRDDISRRDAPCDVVDVPDESNVIDIDLGDDTATATANNNYYCNNNNSNVTATAATVTEASSSSSSKSLKYTTPVPGIITTCTENNDGIAIEVDSSNNQVDCANDTYHVIASGASFMNTNSIADTCRMNNTTTEVETASNVTGTDQTTIRWEKQSEFPVRDEINSTNTQQLFDDHFVTAKSHPPPHSASTTPLNNWHDSKVKTSDTAASREERLLQIPNGDVINAKNTLQSFDDIVVLTAKQNDSAKKPAAIAGLCNDPSPTINVGNNTTGQNDELEVERLQNSHENNVNGGSGDAINLPIVTNVQAMVVPSYAVVMDAQPYLSIIGVEGEEVDLDENDNTAAKDNTTIQQHKGHDRKLPKGIWRKKRSYKIAMIIAILVIFTAVMSVGYFFARNPTPQQTPMKFITIGPMQQQTSMNDSPSLSPTLLSTTLSKKNGLTMYINSVTLLGRKLSIDGVTPEDYALQWIINDDPFFDTTESWLPIISFIETNDTATSSISTVEQLRFIQRYALLTMWFQQMDDTGIFRRTWTSIDKWLIDASECNWYGIKCTIITPKGIQEEVGVVTDIAFILNNITGTISADLGLLNMIQHVVLSSRKEGTGEIEIGLTGRLPSSIGLWTALTYFDVLYNYGLTGSLPSEIGQWTALTHFDVSYNSALAGSLPSTIGQWIALKYFAVSDNNGLTGSIPSTIGMWTALTYFAVSYNDALTGSLPSTIGNWTALTYFDVSDNAKLTGSLPFTIGQWTELLYFDVSYNIKMTGSLPPAIGQWTALTYFDVSDNALRGILPPTIGNWTALTYFDVYGNYALTGILPSTVGQWTALTFFGVGYNAFTGTIPSTVKNWNYFVGVQAYFYENNFIGTMPLCTENYNLIELWADCKSEINCTCCTSCS